MSTKKKTALITGASAGFGRVLAQSLAAQGWQLIINARRPAPLLELYHELKQLTAVEAISGDVRDEILLLQLPARLAVRGWQLDLVVNNASDLGPSPMPSLLDTPVAALHEVFHANAIAPLSLLQKVWEHLAPQAAIVNLSSDAATVAYPNWGNYGAAKAALDHWTAVLALEQKEHFIYAFDPGDMRTAMHQAAFPGEDISDRPLPQKTALPALQWLLTHLPPSGRYVASEIMSDAIAMH